MKKNIQRIWYTIGVVGLFLTLAVFTSSANELLESSFVGSNRSFTENNQGGPWWSSRTVSIDAATVYLFEDPFFELYSYTSNHGNQQVIIKITHVLSKPDGTKEQVSWDQLTLHPGQGVEYWIMCMYLDQQCGKYSYIVTLWNVNGCVLDQRIVSWIREPV